MIYKTTSPQETIKLGKKIGEVLKKGDVIAYLGNLGAGKTTLTRGIALGLGLDDVVISPTFSIVNEYENENGINVYHFDMYRIKNETELEFTGYYDYPQRDSVFIIEWSENIKNILPSSTVFISIETIDEQTREISIRGDNRFESLGD
jgi:tRNA threonylcarbamoyladenosine biosynthesis protein TsaE